MIDAAELARWRERLEARGLSDDETRSLLDELEKAQREIHMAALMVHAARAAEEQARWERDAARAAAGDGGNSHLRLS